jgi:cytochrome P450
MMQDVDAAGLKIRKGDAISISMQHLCRDKNQWIEPDRFIPERFDSKSEFFLTPNGDKRSPFAFSPFLGGMRICLGKTFVETVSKVTLPVLLTQFEFCLPQADTFELPYNNMICVK